MYAKTTDSSLTRPLSPPPPTYLPTYLRTLPPLLPFPQRCVQFEVLSDDGFISTCVRRTYMREKEVYIGEEKELDNGRTELASAFPIEEREGEERGSK